MKKDNIAEQLKRKGYSVSYYKRKEGGIRITRINGVSFAGSKGNERARNILGIKLSEARIRQLEYIRTPKGQWGHKRKEPLPSDIKRKLQNLQKKWRKKGKKKGDQGMPSTSNVRWTIKHEGIEQAFHKLEENERYLKGIAYTCNVIYLVSRIRRQAIGSEIVQEWFDLARYIDLIKDSFREDWIQDIYEILGSPEIKEYLRMSEKQKIEKIKQIIGYK